MTSQATLARARAILADPYTNDSERAYAKLVMASVDYTDPANFTTDDHPDY